MVSVFSMDLHGAGVLQRCPHDELASLGMSQPLSANQSVLRTRRKELVAQGWFVR